MKNALLTVVATLLMASPAYAQVAGKWATEAMGPSGAPQHAYEFKVEGEKLTGVYTSGGNASVLELKEGTVSGSKISFQIVSTTGAGAGVTRKMSGEIKGDLLTLNREAVGLDGTISPMPPLDLKRMK